MADETQPGVRVDRELWEQFREEVARRRGGTRGHLKSELETAIRGYLAGGDTTPERIEMRLERIEATVGVAEADGGADVRSDSEHTHTEAADRAPPAEKPATKAGRSEKICYLTARVREAVVGDPSGDIEEVPSAKIETVVTDEYNFRDQTTAEYVDAITDELGLVEHPVADPLLCTPERREELLNESASDRLDDL
jgi:hypothetical protein